MALLPDLVALWVRGTLPPQGTRLAVVGSRQARLRSGSLVTARLALGKDLWVCPGSPEDPSAEGSNFLLREGAARIYLSKEGLFEDLDLGPAP